MTHLILLLVLGGQPQVALMPLRITSWNDQVGCETIAEYARNFKPMGTNRNKHNASEKGCYSVQSRTPVTLVDATLRRAGDDSQRGRLVQQFSVPISDGTTPRTMKLFLFEGAVEPVPEFDPGAKFKIGNYGTRVGCETTEELDKVLKSIYPESQVVSGCHEYQAGLLLNAAEPRPVYLNSVSGWAVRMAIDADGRSNARKTMLWFKESVIAPVPLGPR